MSTAGQIESADPRAKAKEPMTTGLQTCVSHSIETVYLCTMDSSILSYKTKLQGTRLPHYTHPTLRIILLINYDLIQA